VGKQPDLATLLRDGDRCSVRHASEFGLMDEQIKPLEALRSGYTLGFRNLHSL
jgi:hypothetical protein